MEASPNPLFTTTKIVYIYAVNKYTLDSNLNMLRL